MFVFMFVTNTPPTDQSLIASRQSLPFFQSLITSRQFLPFTLYALRFTTQNKFTCG